MQKEFADHSWALILGGSSGFGLASAARLAERGMNLLIVHRDRRGAMSRIEPEFDTMRGFGVEVQTFNADALATETRRELISRMRDAMGVEGRIAVLLHSIAFGNLKLAVAEKVGRAGPVERLAGRLGVPAAAVAEASDELFRDGEHRLHPLAARPEYSSTLLLEEEDFQRTIHAMGTSLLAWVQDLHEQGLFAPDARVLGLTSEGNAVAWKGYAAVAAAKAALESVARSIAVEFAPYGIRCNVLQPGVTDTPALRLIPGNEHLKAEARARNPFARLTSPDDVADVVYLMARPEAAWINGALIRVDGGEHVSGVRA